MTNNSTPATTKPIITIDGPSGSGKGTIAYRLAQHFGLGLLDSGALYRIVGLMAYQQGLLNGTPDEDKLTKLTKNLILSFKPNKQTQMIDIYIDNQLLNEDIRNETVGSYASKVAIFPKVRHALLDLQQNMGNSGVVADGRDMGTVIFPNADAKIFLTASAEARANRRVLQLQEAGKDADYQSIYADIIARDDRDASRAVAPCRPANDALVIDSSELSIDDVFAQILAFCQQKGISTPT